MSENSTINRRRFLASIVSAGAAVQVTSVIPVEVAEASEAQQSKSKIQQAKCLPHQKDLFTFFNPTEAAFTVAFVDILIPKDELSPSASECGVHIYIDRQLGGAFGRGDRMYRQGPWSKGIPTQGYQLPLTPAELIQSGIQQTNTFCQSKYGQFFDFLDSSQKEQVLAMLSENKVEFKSFPSKIFFEIFYQLSMEGFFSDPIYGGNKKKASWKMIGFPGVNAIYSELIESHRGKKYKSEALSIEDLS